MPLQRNGRRIYQGTIAGIPSGTALTLHLELGYDGIGTSRLVMATVQHDGTFHLSFENLLRTATDFHISDPVNPAMHSRIAHANPSATLTR